MTGLTRAFAGVEKTPDFYLRNGVFWVKMDLVLAIPFAAALMARGAWRF
ncbi:MAG: hypothetical protein ACM369_13515 [Acidobacteriota bacterium]